jgi:hypothetical protein
MTAKRLRLALLGLLGLGILLFLIIASAGLSKLSAKSKDMVGLKQQSQLLDAQLDSLSGAKKQIQQYGYFKEVAKTVIPADKDQAKAILDISQFAAQTGFLIGGITFPTSTLAGQSTTSVPSTTTNAATATPSQIISQAKPVSGIPGLYSIDLTITPQTGCEIPSPLQITYPKMINFMRKIEQNRRTAQITQVIISPVINPQCQEQFNFTLTIAIFIKP